MGLSPVTLLLPSLGTRYVSGFFTLQERTVSVRHSASHRRMEHSWWPYGRTSHKEKECGNEGQYREDWQGKGIGKDRAAAWVPRRDLSLLQTPRRRRQLLKRARASPRSWLEQCAGSGKGSCPAPWTRAHRKWALSPTGLVGAALPCTRSAFRG